MLLNLELKMFRILDLVRVHLFLIEIVDQNTNLNIPNNNHDLLFFHRLPILIIGIEFISIYGHGHFQTIRTFIHIQKGKTQHQSIKTEVKNIIFHCLMIDHLYTNWNSDVALRRSVYFLEFIEFQNCTAIKNILSIVFFIIVNYKSMYEFDLSMLKI
jgi:hypothetical protein